MSTNAGTSPLDWDALADALLKVQGGTDAAALKAENVALRREIDRLRSELVEATARASRLAKLHARASA